MCLNIQCTFHKYIRGKVQVPTTEPTHCQRKQTYSNRVAEYRDSLYVTCFWENTFHKSKS